jgi:hypothetical protein
MGDKSLHNIFLGPGVEKKIINSPIVKEPVGENSNLNFLHSVFRQTHSVVFPPFLYNKKLVIFSPGKEFYSNHW